MPLRHRRLHRYPEIAPRWSFRSRPGHTLGRCRCPARVRSHNVGKAVLAPYHTLGRQSRSLRRPHRTLGTKPGRTPDSAPGWPAPSCHSRGTAHSRPGRTQGRPPCLGRVPSHSVGRQGSDQCCIPCRTHPLPPQRNHNSGTAPAHTLRSAPDRHLPAPRTWGTVRLHSAHTPGNALRRVRAWPRSAGT